MKGIIIYESKYGSTKQYAEWLKEDTGFELYSYTECPKDLSTYDMIILGSCIHGNLSMKDFIVKKWSAFNTKNVAIMLTCAADNREFINKCMERSLPPEILNKITLFPVGGRYVFKEMSFIDRVLIKIVALFQKYPEAKKGMLTESENMNKNNLRELLDFIRTRK